MYSVKHIGTLKNSSPRGKQYDLSADFERACRIFNDQELFYGKNA